MTQWLKDNSIRLLIGLVIVSVIVLTVATCSGRGKEAAQAKQDSKTASATTEAAKDAVAAVVERAEADASINEIVTEAAKDIANAEGSDQAIPPAARNAALRAACRLLSYAHDPACKVFRNGS